MSHFMPIYRQHFEIDQYIFAIVRLYLNSEDNLIQTQ